jgi:isomerase DpgB
MTVSDVVINRSSNKDARLPVDTSRGLSSTLIAGIEALCEHAEDAMDIGNEITVVVELADASGGAGHWPGDDVSVAVVNKWERVLRRLERVPATVIATAHGPCSGPALELLLVADHRITTGDLRLNPPTYHGQPWPGMAVHRLANQLGVAKARRLVLFGTALDATNAARMGIVDEVVDDAGELPEAVGYAATLLSGLSGAELAIRRRLLLDATTTSFEESLGAHLAACDRALRQARA